MQDMDWGHLRFVLAVARSESLAGAARRLGVNETTVARRIARAEQRLGARLFERNRGVLSPTDAGVMVVEGAERVELEVQALQHAVGGVDEAVAGAVRLTSVPIIVSHVLAPLLPSFIREHPLLRVELVAEPRDLSLTKREADLALRLARPTREVRAVARRIGVLEYAVYARAHAVEDPMAWLTYDDSMRDLPQAHWIADVAARSEQPLSSVRVNDAAALLECVKAGMGKSLLPIVVAEREPGLVRLDRGPAPLSRELWLMVHPELRRLPRIEAVADWLVGVAERIREGGGIAG